MRTLQHIMTTNVATLAPDVSLRDALTLFATRHVSGAPVVEGGRVVGVLSQSDLIAFLADPPALPARDEDDDEADAALADDDDPPSAFFTHLWDGSGVEVADRFASSDERSRERAPERSADVLAAYTVADAMTHAVFSLSPHADVAMAADYMRTVGVHRILVLDHDRLVGIVSASDLARAVADGELTRRTFVFSRG